MLWLQNKLFAAWKDKKNVCIFQKNDTPPGKKIMVRP